MPAPLLDRLCAHGYRPPDYGGRGLLNVPATVLEAMGARDASDPAPLADLDPALLDGIRQIVVILADGLGYGQLMRLAEGGHVPFVASLLERAGRRDSAQLLELTTIFPSTTTAAITTMNTARTPQEHGNIAYLLWLEEFAQIAQMLRWGPGNVRRGSFFDDPAIDPRAYRKVRSIHARLRDLGARSYLIEPELFRTEAMTRMHAEEADYLGYLLPTTLEVRLRDSLGRRPWGSAPAYVYAYWAGIDTAAHAYGPHSAEHAAEASALDNALARAIGDRAPEDTLIMLTADHGHAAIDPAKQIDLEGDAELRALLRNPVAGEPRLIFFHTDEPARVVAHLERRYPDVFFIFEREEAIAAGLFGRGDPALLRKRVGEICAMPAGDRSATIIRVEGQAVAHRGDHGGMSADEMLIPLLAWRA